MILFFLSKTNLLLRTKLPGPVQQNGGCPTEEPELQWSKTVYVLRAPALLFQSSTCLCRTSRKRRCRLKLAVDQCGTSPCAASINDLCQTRERQFFHFFTDGDGFMTAGLRVATHVALLGFTTAASHCGRKQCVTLRRSAHSEPLLANVDCSRLAFTRRHCVPLEAWSSARRSAHES